ncbi:nucleotidyltransferase domain-containing protein [Petrotoga sp. Shatin.DS.tank11.9.2.9.3]|uniref:nucleotidyltransferase domain-containing protein n=1 Tax=Petrotoga sp. Shatin.DS.tank11.9.2.9.3 TaxID=1469556 RepID=UPI000EF232BA|nr:nucleotidyltransferase domain-containing protein [Petrotoga sp. Shatin.DS.tank11.9.2.9.3]RLL85284.1 DNA polymerase subunit beta [Petrotoga sp. Shatin.DS.tank11.9.2.9.3]
MVQNKLEFIKDLCKKYKIGLVYLFGSQKEKAYQLLKDNDDNNIKIDDPLTDIDVGIVFLFDLDSLKQRYKLYASIYNELEELFKPYKLDLVFLQETHSVFQTEALKGICVYSESESFKDEYEMMILRRAADFKYVLDLYTKEVLEKYEEK